jgi:predicted nucleic acid-binding protein
MHRIVVDTNVVVAALRGDVGAPGAARALLRAVLAGRYSPLFGNALWLEYQDLLDRPVWTPATTDRERRKVVATLAAAGEWVDLYFRWRPNLQDEADNHLVELAVAGNAEAIVTYNVDDLRRGELRWPGLEILTPAECLERLP